MRDRAPAVDRRSLGAETIDAAGDKTLDVWMLEHGPLSPAAAVLVVLDACAQASRLSDAELARTLPSLAVKNVVRGDAHAWVWRPRPAPALPSRGPVADANVIERLGVMMCHVLTGEALSLAALDERDVRARVRTARPDVPPHVADLVARAATVRRDSGKTLAAFARELRQAIGAELPRGQRNGRTAAAWAAGLIVASLAGLISWAASATTGRPLRHGLTSYETSIVDVSEESAQALAVIDEHTAAIQGYQQLRRLWRTRVPPDDPRVAWIEAHEGWVRTLAGDRFTNEQLLENKPVWFAAALGDGHPYTRTVRLALADTLDARGAAGEAAALRSQADNAARQLFGETLSTSNLAASVPWSPGVLAHVAPNAPEREGFRRAPDGSFSAPRTSTQLWLTQEHGWRLHVSAAASCAVSVVVGIEPRRIELTLTRSAAAAWDVRVEGLEPAFSRRTGPSEHTGVSIVADAGGEVFVHSGETRVVSRMLRSALAPPDPPYAFTFKDSEAGSGCRIVWLEIPVPPGVPLRIPPAKP